VVPRDPKFAELLRRRAQARNVSEEDATEAMRAATDIAQIVLMHYQAAGSPYGNSQTGLARWVVEKLTR
jgi:hypothetical protein